MCNFSKRPFFYIFIVISLAFANFGKPSILHAHAGGGEQGSAAWAVTQLGQELLIAYGSGADYPQYGVLHLDSGYFRLNYGPSSGWGTSIIIPPAFWSGGTYHQGTPVTATWQMVDSNLLLSITGTINGLEVDSTIELMPPGSGYITAEITTSLAGSLPLDDRPGEAFKPVMLSSMNLSSAIWDSQTAFSGCQLIALPVSGWIVAARYPLITQSFGLIGGTSGWKTNAPTIRILLDQPAQIAGWVTPSADPNDDNVGFWAASDAILSSWSYRVVASSGPQLDCGFLPLVLRSAS